MAKERFLQEIDGLIRAGIFPKTIRQLQLPAELSGTLADLVREGFEERVVVNVFVYHLAWLPRERTLSSQGKKMITDAFHVLMLYEAAVIMIEERLEAPLANWT